MNTSVRDVGTAGRMAVSAPRPPHARAVSVWRRLLVVMHLAMAVGWLGVTATFVVLTVWLANDRDPATLRVGYTVHELMVTWLARPAAIGAATTGLLLAISARGRRSGWWMWWVPAKAALLVATVIVTAPTSPSALATAIDSVDQLGTPDYAAVQHTLVALAVYHVVMITAAAGLAVFKPGRRRDRLELAAPARAGNDR
jgi:hypothetical protein